MAQEYGQNRMKLITETPIHLGGDHHERISYQSQ